jgi:hypothetical protein
MLCSNFHLFWNAVFLLNYANQGLKKDITNANIKKEISS